MELDIIHLFSLIGVISFTINGSIVAIEEKYDILGVVILGVVTAFGGGIVRNLLIGVPVTSFWDQDLFLKISIFTSFIVFLLPLKIIDYWKKSEYLFDAIGLSAFAIQGTLLAIQINGSFLAVIFSAAITGVGGGIIRDILAGRQPYVLKEEIYTFWAMISGVLIYTLNLNKMYEFCILFLFIFLLRILSVYFKLKLPKK